MQKNQRHSPEICILFKNLRSWHRGIVFENDVGFSGFCFWVPEKCRKPHVIGEWRGFFCIFLGFSGFFWVLSISRSYKSNFPTSRISQACSARTKARESFIYKKIVQIRVHGWFFGGGPRAPRAPPDDWWVSPPSTPPPLRLPGPLQIPPAPKKWAF